MKRRAPSVWGRWGWSTHRSAFIRSATLPLAVFFGLVLAPEASAQVAAGPIARIGPMQAEIAAQASFDTSYLLELYMTQLAAEGAAPTQAEIDEATRQYFTNGAAVTSVPSDGPGAAYFTEGAAVTGVPTKGPSADYFHNGAEVMAYYPTPKLTGAPGASGSTTASPMAASVEPAPPETQEAASIGIPVAPPEPVSEVQAGTGKAGRLTCSPAEIEMALAIGREYATASAPTSCVPPTRPSEPSSAFPFRGAAPAPTVVANPALSCATGPAPLPVLFSRVVAALCGALLGGLAVVLWRGPSRSA
jgi:hypothetical protein